MDLKHEIMALKHRGDKSHVDENMSDHGTLLVTYSPTFLSANKTLVKLQARKSLVSATNTSTFRRRMHLSQRKICNCSDLLCICLIFFIAAAEI